MTTTVTKIWRTTKDRDIYSMSTLEYIDSKTAHSSVLFTILRSISKGTKIDVMHQDGLNAQLEITFTKEEISLEIYIQSM